MDIFRAIETNDARSIGDGEPGLTPGQRDYARRFVAGYVEALLWSESCRGTAPSEVCDHLGWTGDDAQNCDKSLSHDLNYDVADVTDASGDEITNACVDFIRAQWETLSALDTAPGRSSTHLSADYAGHNFLLTRNGHGTGFWDRGLGAAGDVLSEASRPYGETSAYADEDGVSVES